jgi:hypothetical protein
VLNLSRCYKLIKGIINAGGGPILATAPAEQDDGLTELLGGSLTITGSLVQDGGTFSGDTGQLGVTGIYQENGGDFSFTGGSVAATGTLVADGAVLSGYGSITGDVTTSGEVDVLGGTSSGGINLTGNYTQTAGLTNDQDQLAVSGSIDQTGGTISIPNATSVLSAAGSYTLTAGTVSLAGALDVTGTLEQDGGTLSTTGPASSVYSGSLLLTGGQLQLQFNTLQVAGNLTVTGGTGLILYGYGTVAGEMLLEGGLLTMYNLYTFGVGRGVLVDSGGDLDLVSGTIQGDLVNNGLVTVGAGSAGQTYTITGDYTQTAGGTLVLDVSGWQHDLLRVGGAATLTGALVLNSLDGYDPMPVTSFEFLTYGSRVGAFDSTSLPPCWAPPPYAAVAEVLYDVPPYGSAVSFWVLWDGAGPGG